MPEMAVFLLGLYSLLPFCSKSISIFLLPLRKGTKEFRLLSQELFKLNANNRLNPIFEGLMEYPMLAVGAWL